MPGTHVLFALDCAATLQVRDVQVYLAGTLYPDTRYVTNLPRERTHGESCPHWDGSVLRLNDFEKGWAMHLFYDELVGGLQRQLIPHQYIHTSQFDDWWAYVTAIKLVEDQQSCNILESRHELHLLGRLQSSRASWGEDPKQIERYYALVRDGYASVPTEGEYRTLFLALGVPRIVVDRICEFANELSQQADLQEQLNGFYAEAVQKVSS